MNLRLYIDQCVPRSVSESLREGHAIELLRQHLPINAKDSDVIASAQTLNAILVTLNGDFANIINYPPAKFGGIISLQIRNHPESIPAIVMRLLTYLRENPDRADYSGKLLPVEPHRIRIKD